MKRILMSASAIVFVAALAYGATGAFFSDTETSAGNTFTAGSVDLQVDSTVHYGGLICTNNVWAADPDTSFGPLTRGDLLGTPCNETWSQTDLGPTNQFFNFSDIKPGDPGENTISLHTTNDAWMCANYKVTSNTDGGGDSYVPVNTFAGSFENPPYTLGNINGQQGWSKTGAYDSAVSSSLSTTGFGAQSLRISNGFADGAFGGQTFAPLLSSGAGETGIATNKHFEAQFDLASVLPSLQAGLAISVSPDNGSGARMSYLRFEDHSSSDLYTVTTAIPGHPAGSAYDEGINIFFDDVTDAAPVGTVATFNEEEIATVSRTAPHTIKFVMDFVDGPANDVVKIYIDGVLKATGKSWEDYYRYDPEQTSGGNVISPVNTLIFAARGSSVPANLNNGYLFDNLTMSDGNGSGTGGALADGIQFVTWLDNGDNIHQPGEQLVFGPEALGTGATTTIPLSDSAHLPAFNAADTHYIGVAWCAGTMTASTGGGQPTCDGSTMGNEAQNDSMTADVTLYAEQSRNNPNFLCSQPVEQD